MLELLGLPLPPPLLIIIILILLLLLLLVLLHQSLRISTIDTVECFFYCPRSNRYWQTNTHTHIPKHSSIFAHTTIKQYGEQGQLISDHLIICAGKIVRPADCTVTYGFKRASSVSVRFRPISSSLAHSLSLFVSSSWYVALPNGSASAVTLLVESN